MLDWGRTGLKKVNPRKQHHEITRSHRLIAHEASLSCYSEPHRQPISRPHFLSFDTSSPCTTAMSAHDGGYIPVSTTVIVGALRGFGVFLRRLLAEDELTCGALVE